MIVDFTIATITVSVVIYLARKLNKKETTKEMYDKSRPIDNFL